MSDAPIPDEQIGDVSLRRDNALYVTLYRGLPNHRSDKVPRQLSGKNIGDSLGVSYQSVYRWLEANRIHQRWVRPLTELEGSKLTVEDLLPFVF